MSKSLPVIKSLEAVRGMTVKIAFNDGVTRILDLRPLLRGPVFRSIVNDGTFGEVGIAEDSLAVKWPNGAGIPSEVLRYDNF